MLLVASMFCIKPLQKELLHDGLLQELSGGTTTGGWNGADTNVDQTTPRSWSAGLGSLFFFCFVFIILFLFLLFTFSHFVLHLSVFSFSFIINVFLRCLMIIYNNNNINRLVEREYITLSFLSAIKVLSLLGGAFFFVFSSLYTTFASSRKPRDHFGITFPSPIMCAFGVCITVFQYHRTHTHTCAAHCGHLLPAWS